MNLNTPLIDLLILNVGIKILKKCVNNSLNSTYDLSVIGGIQTIMEEYFKQKAQELYGIYFAGLCEEVNYDKFCEWYKSQKSSEPTYEKFLIAQWVWHNYE